MPLHLPPPGLTLSQRQLLEAGTSLQYLAGGVDSQNSKLSLSVLTRYFLEAAEFTEQWALGIGPEPRFSQLLSHLSQSIGWSTGQSKRDP